MSSMPERQFPLLQTRFRNGRSDPLRSIPWGLAEILFQAYQQNGQTLEDLARRGGFGRDELGQLAVDRYYGGRGLVRWPLLDLYDMAARAARPA